MFSSTDLARLEDASRLLLAPLAAPSVDAWRVSALDAGRRLFQADSAMFGLPHEGVAFYANDGVDGAVVPQMTAYIQERAKLQGQAPDPLINTFYERREKLGLEVFNREMMYDLVDHQHRTSEFYNEIWGRAGLDRVHVLYVDTPRGVANLHLHNLRRENPFGELGVAVLRLLLPSFKAGLDALGRLDAHRAALDAIGEPLAEFDADGCERYRNAALVRLLDGDPDRDRVAVEIAALARGLRRLGAPTARDRMAGPAVPPPVTREVRTATRSYRLRGTLLAEGTSGPGLLVTVTTAGGAVLPAEGVIRERLGLSAREAEVALLLAEGLTNAQVADRLFIAQATARRHTENVLGKLGVSTRAAVAPALLDAA
ncbi:helix-turn-helix transcriptional regulator [Rubrivirga marina]|uniref:HTH luxR-type domain-containing protein n=1 Tax=Rubrivirga marina TaxID=1196024 RepID=A0A271IXP3_9BACT|nr:helix-turn-helix transcriptional regulator [Rubrivirga marina]PAP75972.1 hypothetical protein BSZ37_05715 [Rubrivirga marina]